jgi:hypothetical protein
MLPWTPLDVDFLTARLTGYKDAEFIINGFRNGFPLGLKTDASPSLKEPRALPASLDLRRKILDEVDKGRILGPFNQPPMQNLKISPLHAIPKPASNKVRLIFNLSYPPGTSVNDCIVDEAKSVQYCSVGDVASYLHQTFSPGEAFLAKVDLADAYRFVPIRKQDWRFLGMCVGGEIYVDRMLPMGASSSCRIFQSVSDALRWLFLKTHNFQGRVFNYLDDFLFAAATRNQCEAALEAFRLLCASARIPIAAHKTVPATQIISFLGVSINA